MSRAHERQQHAERAAAGDKWTDEGWLFAVREQALQLRRGVEDHHDSVEKWTDAFLALDGPAVAAAQAEEERLRHELGGIHDALMEAVTHAMARSPATD